MSNKFTWRFYIISLLIAIIIIGGGLYLLNSGLNSLSNSRLVRAQYVTERASGNKKSNQLQQYELIKLASDLARIRDTLIGYLRMGSFENKLKENLRNKYKKKTGQYRLNNNWYQSLPKKLQSLKQKQINTHKNKIKAMTEELVRLLDRLKRIVNRVDNYRKKNKAPFHKSAATKYKSIKNDVIKQAEITADQLNSNNEYSKNKLPAAQEIAQIIKPITTFKLYTHEIAASESKQQGLKRALVLVREALRLNPKNANAYRQKAIVYDKLNLQPAAARAIVQAKEYGISDQKMRRLGDIVDKYEQNYSDKPWLQYTVGRIHYENGFFKKARGKFRQAIQTGSIKNNPASFLAGIFLTYMQDGELPYNQWKYL